LYGKKAYSFMRLCLVDTELNHGVGFHDKVVYSYELA